MSSSSSYKMPSEYDGFVSSAESLLDQFKKVAPLDFMIYKIYPDTEWTIAEAITHRHMILDILEPFLTNYIWHKDSFQLRVVLPKDGEPSYLGGILEFGDNIEDEWFVVFLMYELTTRFSTLSVSVSDMDGEFLLIEAAAHIPDWLGPDNCENRVWIRKGKLHIIEPDRAPSMRSVGMSLKGALEFLRTNQHTFANSGVQKILRNRMHSFPAKITAHKHSAVCAVPKKVAELLAANPQLISSAVDGLGSERDKFYTRYMSNMGFFGATDTVLVPVTFTRALYAQLTFQQRFHPPPRFHTAQRKLQQRGWDRATAKAFDVGCRVACGLEIAYQKSRALEKDGEVPAARQERLIKVKRELVNRKATFPSGVDMSDFVVLSSALTSSAVANSGEPFLLEAFRKSVHLHEEINRVFDASSRVNTFPLTIEEKSPLQSESDEWLHFTPEEFDRNMEERIKRLSVETVDDNFDHHSEVEDHFTPAHDRYPLPNNETDTATDTRILNELVNGMDKFILSSSALGGVGDAEGADSAEDSEDEDKGLNTSVARTCSKVDLQSGAANRSKTKIHGAMVSAAGNSPFVSKSSSDAVDDAHADPIGKNSGYERSFGSPPATVERIFPDVTADDLAAVYVAADKSRIPSESPEDAIVPFVPGPLTFDASLVLSTMKEYETSVVADPPIGVIDTPPVESGGTVLHQASASHTFTEALEFDAAAVASLVKNNQSSRTQSTREDDQAQINPQTDSSSCSPGIMVGTPGTSQHVFDTRERGKENGITGFETVLPVKEEGVALFPAGNSAASSSKPQADTIEVAIVEEFTLIVDPGLDSTTPPGKNGAGIVTIQSPTATHDVTLVGDDKAATDPIEFDKAAVLSFLGGDIVGSEKGLSEKAGGGLNEVGVPAIDVQTMSETTLAVDLVVQSPAVEVCPCGTNTHLSCEENEDQELDEESVDLMTELTRLGLLDPPSGEEINAIREGEWCQDTCRKLEGLQKCVEAKGTEEEWQEAFSGDDCTILQYLFLVMRPEVHSVLQDGASRCLAYGYVACPLLWTYYAAYAQSHLYAYTLLKCAVQRVRDLSRPLGSGDQPDGPEMEGSVNPQTAVSIWLLVLVQLFRAPVIILNAEFRRWRLKRNAGCSTADITTDQFLELVAELLYLTCDMGSESFSVCMKALVAINWQIPLRYSLESTEISDLCARLYYIENVPGLQLHQGLMNMINDIGFPNHTAPETLPCLRLSYNLIMVPDYDGFLYTNDVEVLSHIIIREIDNMSAAAAEDDIDGSNQKGVFDGLNGPVKGARAKVPSYLELVRQMYVRLASALLARSTWANVTTAISESHVIMEMIDKNNERPKAIEHKQSFNTTIYTTKDIKPSVASASRHTSFSHTAQATDSDDDSKVSDIWNKKITPATATAKPTPTEIVSAGMESDSDDDTKVSEIWKSEISHTKSKIHEDGSSVSESAAGDVITASYLRTKSVPGTSNRPSNTSIVDAVQPFDVDSGDEDMVVTIEEYMNAMDSELSLTTMHKTFEKQSDGREETEDIGEFSEVDVERNLLKNLLESHAGQMGGAGPASNFLSQMGVELPKPPHLYEA